MAPRDRQSPLYNGVLAQTRIQLSSIAAGAPSCKSLHHASMALSGGTMEPFAPMRLRSWLEPKNGECKIGSKHESGHGVVQKDSVALPAISGPAATMISQELI